MLHAVIFSPFIIERLYSRARLKNRRIASYVNVLQRAIRYNDQSESRNYNRDEYMISILQFSC